MGCFRENVRKNLQSWGLCEVIGGGPKGSFACYQGAGIVLGLGILVNLA